MLPARGVVRPSELQAAEPVKAAAWAQPAASARRARSPRAEAAGVACVQAAQPREAAAGSVARRWQPPEAAAASGAAADAAAGGGGGGGGAGRGGAAAGGGGGAGAGRGGAAAGGGGAAGALGAAAGGGAPGGGLLGLPSGPTSSLACATTSGADCACDVEVASCATVKAVVASSTMRRFVMMSLVPGKILAATNSLSLTYWTTVNG